MRHSAKGIATCILVSLHLVIVQVGGLIVQTEPVTLGPFPHEMRHGRETFSASRSSSVGDCAVLAAVELDNRDRRSARVALDGDGDGIAVVFGGFLVVGARDGCEGGNASGRDAVACEDVGESATVRLAGRVDAGRVNAVLVLEVVEHFEGEGNVVDSFGGWVALPLFLFSGQNGTARSVKERNIHIRRFPEDTRRCHSGSNPRC